MERAIADNLFMLPEIETAAGQISGLLAEGLSGTASTLRGEQPESLSVVQAREIRVNAIESSVRKQLLSRPGADTAAVFFGSQLLSALENAGNQLFRAGTALGTSHDDELP